MTENNEADGAFLEAFLQKRLPELGLDYETYGPYVLGLEMDDDVSNDDLTEQVEQVVPLLQASSETHADDETVWTELISDIVQEINKDQVAKQEQQQEKKQQQQAQYKASLDLAKKEQERAAAEASAKTKASSSSSSMDEAAKKALMQRYAYEQDDDDDNNNNGGGGGGDEEIPSNRQVAAEANLAKARELRSQVKQTKKEEQIKTKQAKANKEKLKEERRKRTTKGERKR